MRILDLGDQDLGFSGRQSSVAQLIERLTVPVYCWGPVQVLGTDEPFYMKNSGHRDIAELKQGHVAVAAHLSARTKRYDLDNYLFRGRDVEYSAELGAHHLPATNLTVEYSFVHEHAHPRAIRAFQQSMTPHPCFDTLFQDLVIYLRINAPYNSFGIIITLQWPVNK